NLKAKGAESMNVADFFDIDREILIPHWERVPKLGLGQDQVRIGGLMAHEKPDCHLAGWLTVLNLLADIRSHNVFLPKGARSYPQGGKYEGLDSGRRPQSKMLGSELFVCPY